MRLFCELKIFASSYSEFNFSLVFCAPRKISVFARRRIFHGSETINELVVIARNGFPRGKIRNGYTLRIAGRDLASGIINNN